MGVVIGKRFLHFLCSYPDYMLVIRAADERDHNKIWNILEPVIRAGETYPLPRDMPRYEAMSYWFTSGHRVFVAEENGAIFGTYYLRANQQGGGRPVANCGYVTSVNAFGRGIASRMCRHSLDEAARAGFLAMQFNFVVSSNVRAVRLWQHLGFEIVGRLPEAFLHPALGLVDAFVMYRRCP